MTQRATFPTQYKCDEVIKLIKAKEARNVIYERVYN
jgi:hypothetical protein